ncbi:hypothetical protein CVD19_12110 [Bacillus sp. T33-2]|nr:hypothetical protein CVD19_12110 [Bacillus sp. T33-2]
MIVTKKEAGRNDRFKNENAIMFICGFILGLLLFVQLSKRLRYNQPQIIICGFFFTTERIYVPVKGDYE